MKNKEKNIKSPTMKDIARLAGVSQATVSYVINNSNEVSDVVREKVITTANKIGYIPNILARNLKKRETNIIGIIVPDVMNNYYNEMIRYTEKITREKGYFIFICYTMHDAEIEDWYIISLIQQKIAGVIICYGLTNRECYRKLEKYNIKFVVIDDIVTGNEGNSPSILVDNIKGSYLAVQHFKSLGIKDIAYCSEPLYCHALKERYSGFILAMEEFGLNINNDIIYISNKKNEYDKFTLGYIAAEELLSKGKPKGIFASNDQIAFGIIKRLTKMGIKIPEDIAVIGYDNIPFSSIVSPSLTTINQPINTMSKKGVNSLLKMIKKEEFCNEKMLVEPNIVVRESAP